MDTEWNGFVLGVFGKINYFVCGSTFFLRCFLCVSLRWVIPPKVFTACVCVSSSLLSPFFLRGRWTLKSDRLHCTTRQTDTHLAIHRSLHSSPTLICIFGEASISLSACAWYFEISCARIFVDFGLFLALRLIKKYSQRAAKSVSPSFYTASVRWRYAWVLGGIGGSACLSSWFRSQIEALLYHSQEF